MGEHKHDNTTQDYAGKVAVFDTRIGPLFIGIGPPPGQNEILDRGFTTECQRLAKTLQSGELKTAYSPSQPRVPAGQSGAGEWTDGNKTSDNDTDDDNSHDDDSWADSVAAQTGYPVTDIPNADPDDDLLTDAGLPPATLEEQRAFVHAYLGVATEAAKELGVPVENVLGLAALESSWGRSRFALEGNNMFNLYASASGANGYLVSQLPPYSKVAKFDDPADSFASFVVDSKEILNRATASGLNITDPTTFASVMQNSGKYGIIPGTKDPSPGFIKGLTVTIKYMGPKILWEQRSK